MAQTQGLAPTPSANRYLQQLGKHWAHGFTVDMGEACAHIDFGDGSSLVMNASAEALLLTLEGPADGMADLKAVVIEHVDRFAFREGALNYAWTD